MSFYQRIKDLREDADKTQTDIANYLGTTAQYYGKYEKGEREIPFSRAIELSAVEPIVEVSSISEDSSDNSVELSLDGSVSETVSEISVSELTEGRDVGIVLLRAELVWQAVRDVQAKRQSVNITAIFFFINFVLS